MSTIFRAQIKKVEAKNLVSNDKGFRITLETEDPNCYPLGLIHPEAILTFEVKELEK